MKRRFAERWLGHNKNTPLVEQAAGRNWSFAVGPEFRRHIETNRRQEDFCNKGRFRLVVVSIRSSKYTRRYSTTGPSWTKHDMAWMYILKCADDSYYVGSTRNLDLRMIQHQSGKGSRYTSGRLPVELVYGEEYDRIADAYAREKQVQNWRRAKREALIHGDTELLPILAKKKFQKNQSNNQTPLVE